MLSVVVVLGLLGLSGVLIARSGLVLGARRRDVVSLDTDPLADVRGGLHEDVESLDAALGRRDGAGGPGSGDPA